MSEPITTGAVASVVVPSSLAILGHATGLRIDLLLAALSGASLRAVYGEPMPGGRRIASIVVASVLGAILAPAASSALVASEVLGDGLANGLAGVPMAAALGYLAPHLGGWIDRIAKKIMGGKGGEQ